MKTDVSCPKTGDKIATMYNTQNWYTKTLESVETYGYIQAHNYVTEVCNQTL